MKVNWKSLETRAKKDIKETQNLKGLDRVFKKYLGRKGELSLVLRSLKKLPVRQRKKFGKKANNLRDFLKEEIEKKAKRLTALKAKTSKAKKLDITISGKKPDLGHLHPLTIAKREIMVVFERMGFSVVEGPEIESEWYNFDALNVPKEHPARDSWNTLWLKQGLNTGDPKKKTLLRAHTSPVQARYMEKHNPPLRIIVPGKAFRYEATDASHGFQFGHIEGLMVDKDINVSHLKAVVEQFFKGFFKKDLKVRLRPDYFPFTKPSFEIAMTCLVCGGKGCSTCSQTGWLEMAGAGMVHPNVFKAVGYNPRNWQGWAFGFGWDRLAMMRYRVPDLRLFYSSDLRFLQQF
jgi:phenylalanyl-tRNA synthetase alpha chain